MQLVACLACMNIFPLIVLGALAACSPKTQKSTTTEQDNTINITEPTTMTEGIIGITNFHYFTINSLDEGQTINMADFKGKKILIVNVASKCGYTSQYAGLQKLHEQYGDQVQIIGFPCNQFMGQEPGTKEEIATFCSKNYGVTFPLTTKIDVKGKDQHPIYKWLTTKTENNVDDFKVSWNFNKFLVDENGTLLAHFGSGVDPMDEELVAAIK